VYVSGRPSTAIRTPASAGAGHAADVRAQAVERAGGEQLLTVDQARDERVERRPLDPVEAGHCRSDDEEHPETRLRERRVEDEDPGAEREAELGDLDEPTPVERVCERAADEGGHQERQQLREAQEPDHERRAG
jgi:hypothetical protein